MDWDICFKGKNVSHEQLKLISVRWYFLIRIMLNQREKNMHVNFKKKKE